MKEAQEKSES